VKAEGLERCMRCPIGASHAGEAHVERSSFYGGNICPRCRRGMLRRNHWLTRAPSMSR